MNIYIRLYAEHDISLQFKWKRIIFLLTWIHQPSEFSPLQKRSREATENFPPSLQSHLPPEGGALQTRFNVILVLSPGFGHQVGLSLLQTSPLRHLLLFGELPPHLLTDHLLQDTQKQPRQVTTDERTCCLPARGRHNIMYLLSLLTTLSAL